ncbi:RNA 5'-triphosphatase domain-containing protein [Aspergillus fischeri NRRL 181]|uniref:Dual specificity phosphatase, catalytic domain protein n=1 Tax=Neosartorya fischeri (strain ATCC 1020 / DSM 3700 / CBS 544.65 / FGSC A1164 / JCM 1740 / NRRL 181 / WB 181) TaxID=331117 RepID=A1D4R1_NEOFI|nr:dual specificity phosphatase, catalytic domain protein [Aspergillus fischeri NRRL 181]EAW23404.1 dual specificity phosphatase, catalytic domain protein [Aspergillus fischeri NRRL 181]
MGSIGTSLSSPPSRPGLSNTGAALQLWESASAVFSNPTALLSFTRNFQILDQDGILNWGKVAFLTTCIITMAGCGFLSSLLRRKGSKRSSGRKRFRRGIQNDDSKTSPGTTTSSEEEDYDSSGSLHHGTDAALPQEKVTHKHHEQSADANVGPCFGIDLPGCGLSTFAPTDWDAYTAEALAELLFTAIEQHRDREAGQKVVLIGHSMGCSLSALLASSASSIGSELKEHILGLVAICPRASPPTPNEVASYRRLLRIPESIFDMWRYWDRRGGLHSASVNRLVGTDADPDTRELQVRYNKQSKTPVWRRMAWGTLPTYNKDGKAIGGIPGEEVWAGVKTSVLLVAGESDAVTKPAELQKLLKFFGEVGPHAEADGSAIIPDASETHDTVSAAYDRFAHEEEYGLEAQTSEKTLFDDRRASSEKKRAVKTVILPGPASHALLYDRATYRTLAGIIQDFLSQHIDERLSLGWQLQYMNTSGKWDVKNLAKWKKVTPVSQRIANTFVALKMLREVDEEHNPVLFSQKYRDQIYAVIDISYENPVYNPASLEKGGIHYQKHPTVSKIPPTADEVRDFIALVDRLQNEITEKMKKSGNPDGPRPVVGVHCHYGFNRTGFLIVSYLIERLGFRVQDAIDEFERQRPPGIRHGHFIDTLFVRYCVGLKRAPTL